MERNCKNCIHQIVCRNWKKELESTEECYVGESYVTIYDRYLVNGDGCEYFVTDNLFKAKQQIVNGLNRVKKDNSEDFASGTYAKGFTDCAEIILDVLK